MEKIYFSAWRENFEFRTKYGESWSSSEIKHAFLEEPSNDREFLGRFDTLEEAKRAIRDDFGNPMCSTSEQRGNIGWLLTGRFFFYAVVDVLQQFPFRGVGGEAQECGYRTSAERFGSVRHEVFKELCHFLLTGRD